MTRFARWQDWVALGAGLYAAVASIWTTPRTTPTVTVLLVLGALLVIGSAISLAAPESVSMEWVIAVLGVLLFISPWVMGFASDRGPAWTAWITGIVSVIAGLWAIEPAMKSHRFTTGGHIAAHS
jgi:hypothetical protein